MTIDPALIDPALVDVAQWVVVRLVPLPDGRTNKIPLHYITGQPCNAHEPANWTACAAAAAIAHIWGPTVHTIGFALPGFFCVDIDHCRMPDGSWSPLAHQLVAALPGCMVEVSQSGKGLHIWGRYPNPPAHISKRNDVATADCPDQKIECYSGPGRFIAIGTWLVGAIAERCDAFPAFVAEWFPPRATGPALAAPTDGPCAEWRGPTDDDELIRRMLRSKSAGAAFGGKASLADLWTCNVEAMARAWPGSGEGGIDRSSADAALSQHLAWWTGKDPARIERLMRRSDLVRSKWDDRPDYLARTIGNACAMQRDVLQDKPAGLAASVATGQSLGEATGSQLSDVIALDPVAGEDTLALEFVARHGTGYRWDAGLGWMAWDGTVWKRDSNLTRYGHARDVCRRASNLAEKDSEKRGLQAAKTVNGVLTLAQSDARIVVPSGAWDADPFVLNTPVRAIDLRTGETVDRASHFLTQVTSVSPDFNATAPVFARFMASVFVGNLLLVAFMQRAIGYMLTGDRREQVLFFWYGLGANGKSTLLDLIQWLFGSYALKLPAAVLMTSRHEQHPTGIAQIRAKRLAVSSELDEGQFFNEPLVKELTGDSTLTARYMRGDPFTFDQTQKHVIVGNSRPRLRGGDPAMARRVVLVPFDAVFTPGQRDPEMLAKLRAEGPAILAWCIRGAMQCKRPGTAP